MDYYKTTLPTDLALCAHKQTLSQFDLKLAHINSYKPYIGFLSILRKGFYVAALAGLTSKVYNDAMDTPLHPLIGLVPIMLILLAYTLGAVAIKLTKYQTKATNDLKVEMSKYMNWFRKNYGWIDMMDIPSKAY